MKIFVFVVLCCLFFHVCGQSEEDGFRRLLRRASAEADRPLVREQRRNSDDDDDNGDLFNSSHEDFVRKKREEEDQFYHTLLKRTENKRHEKRSFDTDDMDNAAGFATHEDWTGDSRISDADKSELANLFAKLKTENEELFDDTRSTGEENEPSIDHAATRYTAWLMGQPRNKISEALSHKADIDHTLTKILFQDKRDTEAVENNNDKTKVTYPEPLNWNGANGGIEKKSFALKQQSSNNTSNGNNTFKPATFTSNSNPVKIKNNTENTDTGKVNITSNICENPDCTCKKTCEPQPVITSTPCTCQGPTQSASIVADATKSSTGQGPKLCTDDSPQCLCTRACYPKAISSLSPCSCEGEMKKNVSVVQKNDEPAVANVSAVPSAQVSNMAQNPTTNGTSTNDPIAHGWCKQACHPYGVAEGNPCRCSKELNGNAKSFPPRAPAVLDPVNSGYTNLLYGTYQNQQPNLYYYDYPSSATQSSIQQPKKAQVAQEYSTVFVNPETRNLQGNSLGHCGLSCHPKKVLSNDPCMCEQTKSKIGEEKINAGISRLYLNSPNYQGCFSDLKAPTRDLPKRFTRYDTTPENCVQECKYQNYRFAGVQYGYLCFCGNAFGRYNRLPDNDCNSKCKGDAFRNCGGYYHNSVYSVDGKEYDPSDFDFTKIDEEERKRDSMTSTVEYENPAIRQTYAKQQQTYGQSQQQTQQAYGQTQISSVQQTYTNQQDKQGANVATHLMKAAQAALFAAQKLLPSVNKKHKVHGKKGGKVKREDDEEDAQIIQEKMAAMASLRAASDILRKSSFIRAEHQTEIEKRSVDEDSDPYDPEDGKELLTAYMSNVELYKRQTRSVDEEEEEDDAVEKPKFEYRRMTLGETDEGEFVEKYIDGSLNKQKKSIEFEKPLSTNQHRNNANIAKRDLKTTKTEGSGQIIERRSTSEGSVQTRKRRSIPEGSGHTLKRRSIPEGSGHTLKIRSIPEGSGHTLKRRSIPEGSGHTLKRRSIPEGSGHTLKKRSISFNVMKIGVHKISDTNLNERSVREGSGLGLKKRSLETGGTERNRRSLPEKEGSDLDRRLRHSLNMELKDLPEGAVKMAARSNDAKDVESSLRAMETLTKREEIPKEVLSHEDDDDDESNDIEGESESGADGDMEASGYASGDTENEGKMADDGTNISNIFEKRSTIENDGEDTKNIKLRSDVDKGIDSLLNLVVELYKQQKTIKAFESSVRSLRNDIVKELAVPQQKRPLISKKVRQNIEKRAKERLHVLTDSIDNKIRDFAKAHPEASKQAELARSLLSPMPLSDKKYKSTKREITRRAVEFDNVEDFFPADKNNLPDILKEHFRRNSENFVEMNYDAKSQLDESGVEHLSRKHRNVQENEIEYSNNDYGSLFH